LIFITSKSKPNLFQESYASPAALFPGGKEIHKIPELKCIEIGRLLAFSSSRFKLKILIKLKCELVREIVKYIVSSTD
jgi:hypothetical protein